MNNELFAWLFVGWCVAGLVMVVVLNNDHTKHWPAWVHNTITILGGPIVWTIAFGAWMDHTINCRNNRRKD